MSRSPQSHIRLRRTIHVVHGEAFQLMRYDAENGGRSVWFWNSRDGVTPFGTSIDGVAFRHAMRGYSTDYMSALPDLAEYVWVSHTPETWRQMQTRNFERYADDEGPYGGQGFLERFPDVDAWLAITPFEHGQPHQLTRAEFLASTPEWMAKCE